MNVCINDLLEGLSKSKFRGSFYLNDNMKKYVKEKGMNKIEKDAYDFILKRLAMANPSNDGKQTPLKQVHPVFVAQHATGTCCRGCLERIHHIPQKRNLTYSEIEYIITVIKLWILKEMD